MLSVRRLRVRSLDADYNEISWEIEDTQEDVLDYSFQILRSESVTGPWDILTEPFSDRYLFVDRQKPDFHLARQLKYKLLLTRKGTDETKDYIAEQQPESDLIANEIRRHMALLFREFTGRKVWLLPVRTFGQRCHCWNKALSKRGPGGPCASCYDTGFLRGYLAPIELYMQIDTGGAMAEQNQNTGPTQQQNTTARVAYFGHIKPRDVVVEAENRRWRVNAVNQTEQVRAPVHYELQLHQIPPRDIEYSYPLVTQEELRNLAISPDRNFTNPQNQESSTRQELADVFSLYRSFR